MVAPGMPEKSLLLTVVSVPRDDEMAMPPDGPGLSDSEQDLIKRWIEQGAEWAPGKQVGRGPHVARVGPTPSNRKRTESH